MRVESHRSSAGPFVLEGRVPGPELCSVPILPESAPSTAPDFRLSQPKACVGASSGLRQHPVFCLLHTYFPFPGNSSHQGSVFFFTHPGAKQPTEQLKMAPLRNPRAIPALQSPASRVWQGLLPSSPKVPNSPSASLLRAFLPKSLCLILPSYLNYQGTHLPYCLPSVSHILSNRPFVIVFIGLF